ncbi:helix-turn-helix domain-containing protein [Paraburkholderia sp. 5N]|uniref:Helix-turn-helix domain-containing protein n=2 Tax=Paraburkholderia elongata TaxID=2675747 RepID=A0A972NZ70_9BURK|nr:helix-turn-helix domain-containing protein [Paraburkholderia elongata]
MSNTPEIINPFERVLKGTQGVIVDRGSHLDGGRVGSMITWNLEANELRCPALPELVILTGHKYQLSSALTDFGWGFREQFSSALHPIHIFPPGADFLRVLNGPARATFLTIDADRTFSILDELGVANPLDGLWMLSQRGFAEPYVYATIAALADQMAAGECPRLLIDSYCATIVFQLAKRWTAMSARAKQTGRLSPEALGRAIAFINDRLADDMSLDDLASLCGMTKFHFLRLFKASTNSSPYQYLRDRRIERARHLLSTTQYAIGDIAGQCAFASATGFAEMFRKVVGVAPTAWRAAQKK